MKINSEQVFILHKSMYKIIGIIIIVFSLFLQKVYAQDSYVENLQLQTNSDDNNEKLSSLIKLAEYFLVDSVSNYPKSISYAEQGVKLAHKLSNTAMEAKCQNLLGLAYIGLSDYKKAIKSFLEEQKILEKTKDEFSLAYSYAQLAYTYQQRDRDGKALDYWIKSATLAKKLSIRELEMRNYFSMYLHCFQAQEYKDALKYFQLYIAYDNTYEHKKKEAEIVTIQKKHEDIQKKHIEEQGKKDVEIKQKEEKLTQVEAVKKSLEMDTLLKAETIKELNYEKTLQDFEIQIRAKEQEIQRSEASRQQSTILMLSLFLFIVVLSLLIIFMQYKSKLRINKELRKKNDQITDSINYAQRIQQAILISENEIRTHLTDFFILFKPRDIVSGDFYWFSTIDDKVIIAAVDCTGHGVPGAFMSMIGNTLLNEIVNQKGITEPGEILNLLHYGVHSALQQTKDDSETEDGMDMALCTINKTSRVVQFAGAKNHLYITVNSMQIKTSDKMEDPESQLQIVKADIHSIGGKPLKKRITKFKTNEIKLPENTNLYMLSDGYVDQFGGDQNKKFNSKRFKEILIEIKDKNMQEQCKYLEKEFNEWKGKNPQIDDVLVVGIKL